jgi:hypothetical protein
MSEQTNPELKDILNLVSELPVTAEFESQSNSTFEFLNDWLIHYSKIYDFSRGFNVNRCALYWVGYNRQDAFDGQAFVDSCQDSRGSLRGLAQMLDTDLQIFELDPTNHTKPDEQALAMAASYGMMAIEESIQMFTACSFGQGVETASTDAIKAFKQSNNFDLQDFMITHCGLDHAALLGATIAACMKGIPTILEGTSGQLVKAMFEKSCGRRFDNIIATNDLKDIALNDTPGHTMVTAAILLKTIYTGSIKSACGKVKAVA